MRPTFPGATAVSRLRVYDSVAAGDGRAGGTPHLHLVSSEAYLVVAGTGAVQTITRAGFTEVPLRPGSVVWFAPGTVHRLLTDGDLELFVLMANAGLPEAGDAVVCFPVVVLEDAAAYARAAALPSRDARDATARRLAHARRDAAVDGFLALRRAAEAGDHALYERTLRAAVALVADQAAHVWPGLLADRVRAETDRVESLRAAIAAGDVAPLGRSAPVDGLSPDTELLGMCGVLSTYALQ